MGKTYDGLEKTDIYSKIDDDFLKSLYSFYYQGIT